MYASEILGTGSYLPSRVLTNQDLEKLVETSDQWILERTGISSRHIAAKDEVTSDLALKAAQSALDAAGLTSQDIDALIFATVTPDRVMPSAACALQTKLGARNILAFDLSAACSGFMYGMTIADQFIKTGVYRNILVVGAEVLSRIVDYEDRTTCILFGDGAGAVVLGRRSEGSQAQILGQHMAADGQFGNLLSLPAGGSLMPATQETVASRSHFVKMQGRDIFKAAVRAMSFSCLETLKMSGIEFKDVDWFIPHQANQRIIDAVASQLDAGPERVITTISDTGNTSSASIPIALDQAVRSGRIQRGQTVLCGAFGGGLTSGSILFRY